MLFEGLETTEPAERIESRHLIAWKLREILRGLEMEARQAQLEEVAFLIGVARLAAHDSVATKDAPAVTDPS